MKNKFLISITVFSIICNIIFAYVLFNSVQSTNEYLVLKDVCGDARNDCVCFSIYNTGRIKMDIVGWYKEKPWTIYVPIDFVHVSGSDLVCEYIPSNGTTISIDKNNDYFVVSITASSTSVAQASVDIHMNKNGIKNGFDIKCVGAYEYNNATMHIPSIANAPKPIANKSE